ncbi:MAG TPA: ABC transporter permease [Acidobacteriaceae bacterium]
MQWLRSLFQRRQIYSDLAEEIQQHLAEKVEALIAEGMSRKDAEYAAKREFGNIARIEESGHEPWMWPRAESLLADIRFALRILLRDAGFTTVAILALALGIGVNTSAFTAYKAIVARSLDARDPGSMVDIALTRHAGDFDPEFSYPDYKVYRDNLHSFSGVIAQRMERLTLTQAGGIQRQLRSSGGTQFLKFLLPHPNVGGAEFATTFIVSENYFSVLGVAAVRGRTFEGGDGKELAASPSVLISENYWQRRFAGDPSILGKVVRLNGAAFTIIGITPHDFVGTSVITPDFWVPLNLLPLVHPNDNGLRDRENQCCRLYARLAPGVSIRQAQAEMTVLADHLRTLHDPHSELSKPATVRLWPGSPFGRTMDSGLKFAIVLIMVAVGMVLAIACANVASLQLARAASRQNELCLRLSLGATRRRLVRQLLTESALLGLIAGIVALLFTWALLKVSVTMAAQAIPAEYGSLVLHVTPDIEIFAHVFAISLIAGILFGLAPALESSRMALSSAANNSTGSSPGRSRRLRHSLIAVQVAASLVLMISGSMLIRSSRHALITETGYDNKHIVDLDIQFPGSTNYTAQRRLALVRELRNRLAALPGISSISAGRPPDGQGIRVAAVSINRDKPSAHNTKGFLYYTYVQPNYLQTLGIPLLFGRTFQTEAGQPESSVILSESAAQQLWPGQNPIGRTLRLNTDEQFHGKNELLPDGVAYQVIGVARDTRGVELDGSDSRQVYIPMPEDRIQDYPLLFRTSADPAQSITAIGAILSSLDPDLVVGAATLDELLHQTPAFLVPGLAASIASVIGLIGLLLASMGIFGTVSYIVVLRTREVGIRMALGAKKRDILGLILRESTQPVLVGLLVGIALAVGASYLLRGVLYGLNTVDAVSFVGVSLLFLAIALLAAYVPSRRAMRIDPMVALRYE